MSFVVKYKLELLGITTGTYLNFDIDINNLCKKTFQKLNALTRIVSLVNVEKRRTVNESLYHFAFKILSSSMDALCSGS